MKLPVQPYNHLKDSVLLDQIGIRADYLDVHSKTFTSPCQVDVTSAVKQFFFSVPKPFLWMLVFREAIARRIGLKTANGKRDTLMEIEQFTGQAGDRIGLFEVWNRTEAEIITGQRDKHLDFVLSFHLDNKENQYTLKLLTAVQFNSRLGKVYFFVVKPIHKLLMPALIKRLCHRLAFGC
jgi:hypothetical protein